MLVRVRFGSILLKKSALISTVEKYALEIEIFTLSRGFRAQISRSGAQKMHFSGQYVGGLENPTFSTESVVFSRSPQAATGQKHPLDRLSATR
jgi:hypothetical protein